MNYSKVELPTLQPSKRDSTSINTKINKIPKFFSPTSLFSKLTNKFKSPPLSPKEEMLSESIMSSECDESPQQDQSPFTIDIIQTNSPYDSMERHNFTNITTLNQYRAPDLLSINQVLLNEVEHKPKLEVYNQSNCSFSYKSELDDCENVGGKGKKKPNLKLDKKKLEDYEFDQILQMGFFDEDTKVYTPTLQVSLTPRVAW